MIRMNTFVVFVCSFRLAADGHHPITITHSIGFLLNPVVQCFEGNQGFLSVSIFCEVPETG